MIGRRGLSLLEIIVSLLILVSIFIGISSVVLSSKKYRSNLPIQKIGQISVAESIARGENRKRSLTGNNNWPYIGAVSVPSGYGFFRTRIDLEGDGIYTTRDPVAVFVNFD